jgi:hypothetical protein
MVQKLNAGLILVMTFALAVASNSALASARSKGGGLNSSNTSVKRSVTQRSQCNRAGDDTCKGSGAPGGPVPIPYPNIGVTRR